MTEADVIQPSASIASTGKGIRYVGNWAYAYSGIIAVSNSEKTLLDFTSGAGVIVMQGEAFNPSQSNDDLIFKIYMNDVIVQADTMWNVQFYYGPTGPNLIIPPLTHVKVTCENLTAATNRDVNYLLTGRVYGAE